MSELLTGKIENKENNFLTVPQGFGSSGERGMRWFWMLNRSTMKKSVSVLCDCGKLKNVKVRPCKTANFVCRCGRRRDLILLDYREFSTTETKTAKRSTARIGF